jgi:hypothetical protein
MNFWQFLQKAFSDPTGEPSSKRIMGAVLIVTGIIYAFITKDGVCTGVIIAAGTGLYVTNALTGT